jgi:CRP-like cAMP-binding protein
MTSRTLAAEPPSLQAGDSGRSRHLSFEVRSFAGSIRNTVDERAGGSSLLPKLRRRPSPVMAVSGRLRRGVSNERSTRTPRLDPSVMGEGQFFPHVESWLLDQLNDDEKKLAAKALENCAAHFLPAGSRRFWRDLVRAEALLVENGFLVVRSSSPEARQVVVAEGGAGSLLLAPSDREHLHALTDCWLTVLPLALLDDLLAIPGVATTLFGGLGTALRLRQDATSYFANLRHIDRVRQKLLQLAEQFGRVSPDGIRLEFPLTHGLLADMTASARETVTRCVDELQRDGFMVRDGHSYRLLISPEDLDPPE